MHGGGRLELRWRYGLIALAIACGSAPDVEAPPAEPSASSGVGGEMPAADVARAEETLAPLLRDVVRDPVLEPRVLTPLELTPAPVEPARVRLALLTLEPGGTFRPPSGPCQDVLVLVREGEPRAVGTGIAPPAAPSTLYAGDAVRFGPEGDGLLQNLTDAPVRTVVAYTRPEGEPSLESAGEGGCPVPAPQPGVVPLRTASVRSTMAYAALGGAMRVHILLDADGAGARHGGISVVEGEADLTVPAHRHDDAAEILLIERGSGRMRIGEREIAVRPGMAIYVPRGALHDFRGDGATPLSAVQIYSPSGAEQRFRRSPSVR